MRRTDVFDLISHAMEDLDSIKISYENSLKEKSIPPSLKIDIKNFMENLRSTLDYMAHDVYDSAIKTHRTTTGKKQISKIYFPYGKDEADFKSILGKNLPELDTLDNNVCSIIESIQPHKSSESWLYDLCTLVNQNKHNSLTPQTRTDTKRFGVGLRGRGDKGPSIKAPAWGIKAPPGSVRIGNVPITFDSNTGIPTPTKDIDVKVTTWVSFQFSGTQINVLPFLDKSLLETEKLAKQLYTLI